MFETYKYWNISERTYSADWTHVWFNWVNRQVDIVSESYDRQRRRAYYTRGVQA